jgi:dynactin 1
MIEKLQRKLDDTSNLLHRKEKEFEETMDHLQADIDLLVSERGELKDRMKMMSKKALIEGLTKSSLSSSGPGPASLGPSLPSPVRDSPLLVQQLQDLRGAVESLQAANGRLQADDLRERLGRLAPLRLPGPTVAGGGGEKGDVSKEAGELDLKGLTQRCNRARAELYELLSSRTVVDIRPGGAGAGRASEAARRVKEAALRREVEGLQVAILKLQTGRAPGRRADTQFGTFASRDFAKLLNSKEYSLCGQLDLTAGRTALEPQEAAVAVVTDRAGLLAIHSKVLAI